MRNCSIVSLLGMFAASSALADDREQCVSASSSAQDLRRGNKLIDARAQLLVCARDLCPTVIRRDCAQWLNEVEAALPNIVVVVKDEQHHDVVAARVLVDGAPFLEQISGLAVPINPGPHKLRLEVEGAPPVEQDILIVEGQKNRVVEIAVPHPEAAAPQVTPAPKNPPGAADPAVAHDQAGTMQATSSKSLVLPIAVGAGAVVLGIAALAFELKSGSTYDESKKEPDDAKQHDLWSSANTQRHVAQALGVASLASAGVAVWLWLRAGHEPASSTTTARRRAPVLQPLATAGVAGLQIGGQW